MQRRSPLAPTVSGLAGDIAPKGAPTGPGSAEREQGEPLRKLTFPAFGTNCEIQYSASDDNRAARFEEAALNWTLGFQAKYSRFVPGSLISRINAAAGTDWVAVDPDMETMLDLCDALFRMTRGLLDPTALPLIHLWNWKTRSGSPDLPLPSASEVGTALKLVGWTKVKRQPGRILLPEKGMSLDFGGFGKEYAVDIVARIATEQGIRSCLVDFGHDLKAVGAPPGRPAWHVGLEDPDRPGTHTTSIGVMDRAVASSGDYLRSFVRDGRRYGHIIDPRTGRPVANGCTQVTVVAPTCLHAGVLSTTAFMLGIPEGIEFIQSFPGAEGLIIRGPDRAQTCGFFNYVAT